MTKLTAAFLGSGHFAARCLELISGRLRPEWVLTNAPRGAGRGLALRSTPVWELAQKLGLPSAPGQFIHYFEEADRPQAKLDRMVENGMAVCAGRLREDSVFDYKFIGLSHNTLRGAAGGAELLAELLAAKGYFG